MRPERQFWLWVMLFCAGVFVLVGGQAMLFYYNHGDGLSLLPRALRTNMVVFLAMALFSLLPFLVWGMRAWYHRHVLPMHRIREDVEALVYGSHHARLPTGEEDPAGLAALLNALMERYQHGEEVVEARLEAAMGALAEETARLESLLDALSEAVVVFSQEGLVVRFNGAARRLFDGQGMKEGFRFGGGTAISRLVDPGVIDYAREVLPHQIATGVSHPVIPFRWNPANGEPARPARIAPLLIYGGRLEGFVLTVESESHESPSHEPPGHGSHSPETAPTPLPGALRSPGIARGAPALPAGGSELDERERRPLSILRYVVVDTETTGLNPAEGDRAVSIGAVVVTAGGLVKGEQFHHLLDPRRPISPAAQRVHGIGEEDVRGLPTLAERMPDFVRFAADAVLVAHNAAFDMAFLGPAAQEAGVALDQPVLDTMLLSSVLHPHQPSHSLDNLLARYGIAEEGRHTALGDARMTAQLLLRLLPQLEQRGVATLGAAIRASRRAPLARLSYL